MSHYTIDYSDLPKAQKSAKAVKDVENWYGKRTKHVRDLFLTEARQHNRISTAFKSVLFGLEFSGVQGYPARVYAAQIVLKARAK